jgi:hypothetical protein
MRVIKSLCLFGGLAVAIGACFESPEYPNTPKIAFEDIYFMEANGPDSLVLVITFQDGDGNLGLPDDQLDPRYEVAPFNRYTYAIKTSAAGGYTTGIVPNRFTQEFSAQYNLQLLDLILLPANSPENHGQLLSDKDLDNEAYYNSMPADVYPNSCIYYGGDRPTTVYVLKDERLADRKNFTILDSTNTSEGMVYRVQGRFYKESNPNTANIDVVFEYIPKDNDPTNDEEWKVYDFRTSNTEDKVCATSFNGRFPILTSNEGSLDGLIRYFMGSNGFFDIFGDSQMRLRVKIRDRELNVSNEIVTPTFTLTSIRR